MHLPTQPPLLLATLLLAGACGDASTPPDAFSLSPEERIAIRVNCHNRRLPECDEDPSCFVHVAHRIYGDRQCLESTRIACMWIEDCTDQAIVQIEDPAGNGFVSFQSCHPLGWKFVRDPEHPEATGWPTCEERDQTCRTFTPETCPRDEGCLLQGRPRVDHDRLCTLDETVYSCVATILTVDGELAPCE